MDLLFWKFTKEVGGVGVKKGTQKDHLYTWIERQASGKYLISLKIEGQKIMNFFWNGLTNG